MEGNYTQVMADPSMAKLQDRRTVHDALEDYERLLGVLEKIIAVHSERVGPVLAPVEPSPTPNGGTLRADHRPCSDVTNRVVNLNETLHSLTNRLDALTIRVEL